MNIDDFNIAPDKFKILQCLKKEGDYAVYYATQNHPLKNVLLKTIKIPANSESMQLSRLKREARLLVKLDHHNIIRVLDSGISGDYFYISVEFFENKNLREVIASDQLPPERIEALFVQLLTALAFIHSHRIIHRDIKPENILIGNDNTVKLADFGLSVIINDSSLTQHQSIVGTPAYMSPAQLRGEELSEFTDLFSAGIVYYELITGANPFLGKDVVETVNSILNFGIPEREKLLKDLPEKEKNLLQMLLRVDREEKSHSAIDALEYMQGNKSNSASFRRILSRRKNFSRLFYFSIFIGLVIAVLATWYAVTRYAPVPNQTAPVITKAKDTSSILTGSLSNSVRTDSKSDSLQKVLTELIKKNDAVQTQQIKTNTAPEKAAEGELLLETSPWVNIYSDTGFVDATPIKKPIKSGTGILTLRLRNPAYPEYTLRTAIQQNQLTVVRLNLDTLFGKLDCKILPWGEIYINGKLKGITPLKSPIILSPGEYEISVKHPDFPATTQKILIQKKEMTVFKHNFANK